ncbi:MAG: phosphatase PAP2 family protein [Parafilimonas sp.]|nr:phosphatase PAP2 family protein [Parafilimonas sp.]
MTLLNLDTDFFYKINTVWTNSFFDNNFPWLRDATTWYPVYLFLLVLMLYNFGWRSWTWVVFIALNVTITDQLSSSVIKHLVPRLRPCQDANMADHVRMLVNHCSGGNSFPSSHATNHFGAAVFIYCTLRKYCGNWIYLFFIWAAIVSYGQVYVGVHYPTDVLGGAIIGSIIGFIVASIYNKTIGLPPLKTLQKPILK